MKKKTVKWVVIILIVAIILSLFGAENKSNKIHPIKKPFEMVDTLKISFNHQYIGTKHLMVHFKNFSKMRQADPTAITIFDRNDQRIVFTRCNGVPEGDDYSLSIYGLNDRYKADSVFTKKLQEWFIDKKPVEFSGSEGQMVIPFQNISCE